MRAEIWARFSPLAAFGDARLARCRRRSFIATTVAVRCGYHRVGGFRRGIDRAFVGLSDAPLQLVRVAVTGCRTGADPSMVTALLASGRPPRRRRHRGCVVVRLESLARRERWTARVHFDGPELWRSSSPWPSPAVTMFMISHFHYDPVCGTPRAPIPARREDPPGRAQANGFAGARI